VVLYFTKDFSVSQNYRYVLMTPTDAAITAVWKETGNTHTQQEALRRLEDVEGDS